MKTIKSKLLYSGLARTRLIPALSALGLMGSVHAASLAVDIFVSDLGNGTFRYDLTVSNTGSDDIPLLSINDAPVSEAMITLTLMAPAGFASNYDPIGFIDFAGDTSSFSPGSTLSGFGFESSAAPGTAFNNFSALTNDGESATVTTMIVPEPSTAVVAALAFAAGMIRRRR